MPRSGSFPIGASVRMRPVRWGAARPRKDRIFASEPAWILVKVAKKRGGKHLYTVLNTMTKALNTLPRPAKTRWPMVRISLGNLAGGNRGARRRAGGRPPVHFQDAKEPGRDRFAAKHIHRITPDWVCQENGLSGIRGSGARFRSRSQESGVRSRKLEVGNWKPGRGR